MEQRFTGEERIGAIVSDFPGASNLLKEYRIDFCCGGDRSLLEAVRSRKLDEREVLSRLNASYEAIRSRAGEPERNWQEEKIATLIDYIVQRHHGYLRKELPLLSGFVTKILRVHGGGHPELAAVHKIFHQMKLELDQHLIEEEETLFPLFKQYESEPAAEVHVRAVQGLRELEADHSSVGEYLKAIRMITNDFKLPPEACKTYTLAFRKLEELESDMFEHVHLENNILFPRITSDPSSASATPGR
ncbi:iron-sulfur cluster repair di-iron protein [Cohnella fermenti]|uniref:Iron-sulfur cluster repair di-iron protein n=1 Tax=Cohnella fermenti TaxID=2565925 RepID=A0A4V3WEE8_9BACL|nr:iron-sulfur cluster repair di-iron protein [Cohnella fermenti]THF76070.1 iron-sulfur cluster repair di-iron protein [Cohnella fermenti]